MARQLSILAILFVLTTIMIISFLVQFVLKSFHLRDQFLYKKDKVLTFKLCSVLANKNLATYDLIVPYFKSGSPEKLFLFLDVEKVIVSQYIYDPASQYTLMCRLLQGDTLAYFNCSTLQHVEENVLNFATCINQLITNILPAHALEEQCQYMHTFIWKPQNAPSRRFVTRLFKLNEYLQRFSPFRHNQWLPLDELLDIAKFVVPQSW